MYLWCGCAVGEGEGAGLDEWPPSECSDPVDWYRLATERRLRGQTERQTQTQTVSRVKKEVEQRSVAKTTATV